MNRDAQFAAEKSRYSHWVDGSPDKLIRRRREIQYLAGGGGKGGGVPPGRTAIKRYTPAAAGRLRRYIDNYYRDFKAMVTLTYGNNPPMDGLVVKKHLKAFIERLRRTGFFEADSLVWWLEFQVRGAAHIHFVTTGWLSRRWVALVWAEISGGDMKACTRVEGLRDADGIGAYAAKYAAKSDQKEVPEGYINVGRYWGQRGGPRSEPKCPKVVAAAIPVGVRVHMRALAREYERVRDAVRVLQPGARAVVYARYDWPQSLRVYEHEGGWSVYGSAKEIDGLWAKLERQRVITGRSGQV